MVTSSSSERHSPSVGLLISVLVRYPEIASVQYDHRDQGLRFSFLLSRELEAKEISRAREVIEQSLAAYFYLQGKSPKTSEISVLTLEGISVIQIRRDVASLSQEEISMVNELVKDRFGGSLVTERPEGSIEDDPAMQEEMIQEMLDDLKEAKQQKNLVAFREEGRVLVYNK